MSAAVHTVTRSDNLIGFGNRPDLTPAHQVERETGITAATGGVAFGLPNIWANRTKPVSGSSEMFDMLHSVENYTVFPVRWSAISGNRAGVSPYFFLGFFRELFQDFVSASRSMFFAASCRVGYFLFNP